MVTDTLCVALDMLLRSSVLVTQATVNSIQTSYSCTDTRSSLANSCTSSTNSSNSCNNSALASSTVDLSVFIELLDRGFMVLQSIENILTRSDELDTTWATGVTYQRDVFIRLYSCLQTIKRIEAIYHQHVNNIITCSTLSEPLEMLVVKLNEINRLRSVLLNKAEYIKKVMHPLLYDCLSYNLL